MADPEQTPMRRQTRDRGASTLELAILFPFFLFLVLLVVQAGLYFDALNVTQAVAQSTSREVRAYPGGSSVVYNMPAQGALQSQADVAVIRAWNEFDPRHRTGQPSVEVRPVGGASNQVTFTVRSSATNLLHGILPDLPVTAKVSGPVEVFKRQGTN
jgi:TadE-like protein